MNDIAKVMNLQTNFQQEYRLHRDTSNQTRNDIITKYHRRLLPILRSSKIDLRHSEPNGTIGFAQYFNDVLENVPKNSADENYHRFMYICDVTLMDATDQVDTFQVPLEPSESGTRDYTRSVMKALDSFNRFQERAEQEGASYTFLSFSVDWVQGKVIIRYAEDDPEEGDRPGNNLERGDSNAR